MELGNTPVAIHNEYDYSKENPFININSDHLKGHMPLAVQNQKGNMQAVQDQLENTQTAFQNDMNQPVENTVASVQNQIGKVKNKRGRPKKMKRKMPLTLEKETKRVQEQKRKSYIKHKLG